MSTEKPLRPLPLWEDVLSSASRLQQILPGAVLVGSTASSVYAHHRMSTDAGHILPDLRSRFDEVLAQLESVAGWKTARVNRPVLILGSLDGIETGIRQLIREAPLESTTLKVNSEDLEVPTPAEILRIKAVLILKRNATRDYLDFAALADHVGNDALVQAMTSFDSLYPQNDSDTTALSQLQIQLASPLPYDLDDVELSEYKNLAARWHDWNAVRDVCIAASKTMFERITVPLSQADSQQAKETAPPAVGTQVDEQTKEEIDPETRERLR